MQRSETLQSRARDNLIISFILGKNGRYLLVALHIWNTRQIEDIGKERCLDLVVKCGVTCEA